MKRAHGQTDVSEWSESSVRVALEFTGFPGRTVKNQDLQPIPVEGRTIVGA